MDIEIFLHGVPNGQDFYGTKEEQANMGMFYDTSTESVKYVVETKKLGDKAYTYYSYLRYKGLIGAGGRPGSYFGLTLRFDKYYQDALHIYNLLEIIFKRYVVGNMLMQSGESYKYAVSNFADKTTEIGQMQQALIQLIQATCIPAKFLNIDASFINPITAVPSVNIADISETAILASIKKYSKIVLSPDYETNIEKECKKKVQEAEGKGSSVIAQKDKTIAEKDGTITSLNTTISTQKSQISSLEQEVKQKNAEIQKQNQKGNLSQSITKIEEPIRALADYFRVKDSHNHEETPKYGHKNFWLGIASCIISLVVLALCAFALFRSPKGSVNDEELTSLKSQVVELTQQKQELENEIQSKDQTIAELQAKINQQPTSSTPPTPTTVNLRIDIAGYSSGDLSTEKEYSLSIKEGKSNYSGRGKWTLTNAKITSGKETDTQIKIKPIEGNVVLSYKAEDINCFCKNREIIAAKPAGLKIVIDPYVTEVEVGKEYTFSISGYSGKGLWEVDGFSQPVDKNASTVTVNAIEKGNREAIISYTPNGGKKETNKYNYKK